MPKSKNAFYAIVEQYLARQPDAKPAEAWRHFATLAQAGALPELVGFDGDAIEVRPNPERTATRRIGFEAFARQASRIRQALSHVAGHSRTVV